MSFPKPFHEAIVDAVNAITFKPQTGEKFDAYQQLQALVLLTSVTAIPRNHDAIAEAFRTKMEEFTAADVTDWQAKLSNHLESEKVRALTGNDLKEPLYGDIRSVSFGGRTGIIKFDEPQDGCEYAVINDQTRGRIQLMNQGGGVLKSNTRVKIVAAQRGSEAYTALEVSPVV